MTWYRTGTAAFTNGNTTVTGTGTAWIANASIGEGLIAPDGRIYEITAVASDTSLTISPAYLGSTASGQAYAIAPIRGRIAQLLSETSSLLASFATVRDGIGSGLFPNGTVSAPALRAAADQDTGLFFPAANTLAMATGGAERMRITSAGLVGIGTTAPGSRLHLAAPSAEIRLNDNGAINTTTYGSVATNVNGDIVLRADPEQRGNSDSGIRFEVDGAELARFRGTSLGIGTTSPVSDGSNYAGLSLNGAAGGIVSFLDDNVRQGWVGSVANELRLTTTTESGYLTFRSGTGAAGTERMRIDASGNVGIGTTVAGSYGRNIHLHDPATTSVSLKFSHTGTGTGAADGLDFFMSGANGFLQNRETGFLSFGTSNTERLRINSNGNVGIGTSSPIEVTSQYKSLTLNGTVGGFVHFSDDNVEKGRVGTVLDDLTLSAVAASGNISFRTGGSGSADEAMRITSAGIVRPGADNTQSLGEASFRWSTVFAGTGTINTSDEREKVWRGAMSEAEMRAAKRLLAELGMFQFTDSVEEKGEDARLHFGVRAQKAFAILEDEGLEWWRYAWCCHDKWDEITEPVMEEVTVEKTRTVEVPEEREVEKTETVMEPVFDEETGEQVMDENGEPVMTEIEQTFTVTETVMVEVEETYEETEQRDTGEVRVVREAGDRYGIRADQLAYWLIAAQAEIQSDLDARLAKLEAAQ